MSRSSSTWKDVLLEEVCDEITVGYVGTMAKEYIDTGIPFLRSLNIKPFQLDLSDIRYISQDFHQKIKKSVLFPGDLVVVRTGNPGTSCVIPDGLTEANCSDMVIIRASNQVDALFLSGIFNSVAGRANVLGRLVGVAQQHFNVSAAKKMTVRLPPIDIQYKVSAIISSLNNLIENNRRRIQLLEEMSRALYREWFVHFRFPGHEDGEMVDSELGEIPEEWELTTVGKAFDLVIGGTPSKKSSEYWDGGNINWHRPSEVTSTESMFIDESEMKITSLGLEKSSAKIVPERSVIMTAIGTIGAVAVNSTPATTNQNCITCVPNERVSPYHIYFWIKDNATKIDALASGAAYKIVTKTVMKDVCFLLPPQAIEQSFKRICDEAADMILNLLRTNKILNDLRDLLLPRLVSGKIEVSDLKIEVPTDNHQTSKYSDQSTLDQWLDGDEDHDPS
ncbi:MAG: restriction endonuclease subunit S [Candidatus Thorarchaeota archaeon]